MSFFYGVAEPTDHSPYRDGARLDPAALAKLFGELFLGPVGMASNESLHQMLVVALDQSLSSARVRTLLVPEKMSTPVPEILSTPAL